jgi:hypothetical protein
LLTGVMFFVPVPTQRYKGCLASRLQPADYEHCLDNYDDEQFQNIGLVPTALKQRVYDKGEIATQGILQETLTRKTNTIIGIPSVHLEEPGQVQRLLRAEKARARTTKVGVA